MSFDLSSTTSSDEASVVDISALLPDKNDNKGTSSLLFESSSSTANVEDGGGNDQNDSAYGVNSSKFENIAVNTTKRSLETFGKEAKGGNTIRVVMGESIKIWKTNHHRTNKSSKSKPNNNHGNKMQPHTNQPNFVVVQQRRYPSSDPMQATGKDTSQKIDFEKSRLDVQRSMSGKNNRVEIIVETPLTSETKGTRYTIKTCKNQLLKNGNKTLPTSSAFVDCIAIWDPQRQVYTLEVPELIVDDIRFMPSSDDDDQNTVEQQRQSETKLFHTRKRRRS